jgi:hypothetical protein
MAIFRGTKLVNYSFIICLIGKKIGSSQDNEFRLNFENLNLQSISFLFIQSRHEEIVFISACLIFFEKLIMGINFTLRDFYYLQNSGINQRWQMIMKHLRGGSSFMCFTGSLILLKSSNP